MFDFSFGELFLVLIAALLCIGPKEMPAVARSIMSFFRSVRNLWQEIASSFTDMVEEPKPKTRMIQGDDGKMYESYDAPVPEPGKEQNR